MPNLQIALYARVSTDQQARGNTVDSQVAALCDRIGADGVALEAEDAFVDEGFSGTTLRRPALERLRDRVAGGLVDRIYVLAPDRLARRYAYQVLLIEEFRRAGAEVVFVNRPIGASPEDDLLLQVQGMVAEYERAKILERSRRGRRHAARSGLISAIGRVPFGYRYVTRDEGGGVARVEAVEEEARWVRLLFAWIGLDRLSLREACRRLQEAGRPTRTGLARWDPTTVALMLRNTAYVGRAVFGRSRHVEAQPPLRPRKGHPHPSKAISRVPVPREEWIEIPVPALVDAAVFDAAQAQLETNRRHRRERRRRPGWLLQGLVVCRRCGYGFYGKMARGLVGKQRPADYGYYRCPGTDAHRFAGTAVCDNRSVRSDRLERAVWDEIRAVLEDPRRLAAEYERRLAVSRGSSHGAEAVAALERQIAAVRRGIGRLIDSYAELRIERDEFEPRVGGMRERLAQLEGERERLVADAEIERSLALVIGRVEDFADRVHGALDEIDWDGTREIIRAMVRRVEVDGDHVHVVFRVPALPPPKADDQPFDPAMPARGDWQHCGGHPACLIREDADDIGAAFYFLVQALYWVGRV
jgi:site-specific DNA recombinase